MLAPAQSVTCGSEEAVRVKQVTLFCVVNFQQDHLLYWVTAVLSCNSSTRQRGGNVLEDRDGVGLQKPGFGPAVAVQELHSSGFFVVLQRTPRVSGKKSYLCPCSKCAANRGSLYSQLPNPPTLQLNILFL